MQVSSGFEASSCRGRPTIAVERAPLTVCIVLLSYGLTFHDHMFRAFCLGELIVATARLALTFVQLPLLETTYSYVLSEQHVESGIDLFERVIADEDNCIKALKNHADLWSRVPAVVAADREVRLLKPVSTASAHGFQKCCTVIAVKRMLGSIFVEWNWRYIEVC